MSMNMPNLYTRWTRVSPRRVKADILLPKVLIEYDDEEGMVIARVCDGGTPVDMDPDTARMIGVRLIEAATRAESERKVRS